MSQDFAHLHLHTEYSILDGACRISEALETAREMGMDSLAITDHGVMYGALEFYQKALKCGIRPILGSEVYVAPGGRLSRERGTPERPNHLVLLAENNIGYENLMRIVTRGFTEGFYYKPRVDKEVLTQHSEGLIALSACLKGEIPAALLAGDEALASSTADEYVRIFGEGNFYIELMDHGIEEQKQVNPMLVEFARKKGIPLVATNDIHYVKPEDSKAHDYLLCIQTGKLLAEPSRMRFSTEEFYLKSPEQMAGLFPDFPEALANTVEIASRCNVEIPLDTVYLPRYEPPEGYDLDSFLDHLAAEGIRERFPEPSTEVTARLERELDVIKKLKFSGYFLIVWDFVKYAKEKGIKVGPGRGSAAGSLVAYALGITTIDPLQYGLLFERFLTPERVALPDIDIDFSHNRRSEVIEYVANKYGKDRVAQIISFSRLNTRAAVKDVGRVMDVPYARMDALSKMVPEDPNMNIELALKQSSDLRGAYENDKEVREIIDTARSLEGLVRHDTIHAAGVVIADNELTRYTPLQRKGGDESEIVTQYDMYNIENLGLLKVDLLGLRNQSLLELAVNLINSRRNEELDIDSIPMDDPETFKLIQSGQTVGTFQLASPGMRALMRDMVPSKFEEIIALIALYRPGPLSSDMHKVFVDQKHGRKTVTYPHPSLEEALRETYGVIVYQEQAMRIAQVLAGYSGLEADELRKAMAKKKPEIMIAHREKFIDGACDRGVDQGTATRVFDLIEKFGGYGFNKSHSTAYAFVSYQTAYLKAHYPTEYMAALMTIYMDNQDRLVEYINECRRMGIEVRLPDINMSDGYFTPYDSHILFGLSAVRNVGSAVVEQIISARDEGGDFADFMEFCDRVPPSVTNKKTMESLVKAGAFDSIEEDRSLLLATYDLAVSTAQRKRKEREEGQFSLFDDSSEVDESLNGRFLDDYTEIPKRQLLAWEREMLGVFVSDHPLSDYRELLSGFTDLEISQISPDMDKAMLAIGGLITGLEKRYDKAGKPWASFTLEDFSGSIDVLLFHNKYEKYSDVLVEEAIVLVRGRADLRDNSRKLLADEVRLLPRNSMRPIRLILKIDAARFTEERTSHIKEVLMQHPGELPVRLQLYENGMEMATVKLGELYSVGTDGDVLGKLKSLLGESAAVIQYPEI
ncbi:MAG: DNA polymerase III subunit alpha [Actinobacteria bacterium]|nr:DNA polymerase III subunit alpha [Actinomycetota bacterium]MCG2795140.1 DNA polymerase III subunit alpha [Actinomycetes bacterium]